MVFYVNTMAEGSLVTFGQLCGNSSHFSSSGTDHWRATSSVCKRFSTCKIVVNRLAYFFTATGKLDGDIGSKSFGHAQRRTIERIVFSSGRLNGQLRPIKSKFLFYTLLQNWKALHGVERKSVSYAIKRSKISLPQPMCEYVLYVLYNFYGRPPTRRCVYSVCRRRGITIKFLFFKFFLQSNICLRFGATKEKSVGKLYKRITYRWQRTTFAFLKKTRKRKRQLFD